MRSLLVTQYYLSDQNEDDDIGGMWHNGAHRVLARAGDLKIRVHTEERGVGGSIILKWILQKN
jgi:hypothetical protein